MPSNSDIAKLLGDVQRTQQRIEERIGALIAGQRVTMKALSVLIQAASKDAARELSVRAKGLGAGPAGKLP
jgi:hypothetical protein